MPSASVAALLVAGAYAAGTIPWGLVLGRQLFDVDLTRHGSRSTGATNALRVLGWRMSAAVFALDFLKGFLPVAVARLLGLGGWWVAAMAVASVIGHCWSPLIHFRGGKGMATGAGAAAGMLPWVLLVFPLMAAIVAVTRYVSLASLVGSVAVSLVVVVLGALGLVTWSILIAFVVITAIIIVKHEGYIHRLLASTARRFGESDDG